MNPLNKAQLREPLVKVLAILIITSLLLIPNAMIRELIKERSHRKSEVQKEVAIAFGHAQKVMPPLLRIPYTVIQIDDDVTVSSHGHLTRTAEGTVMDGYITTDIRRRSIYEVVTYDSEMPIAATLAQPSSEEFTETMRTYHYDQAHLIFGLSDPDGLSEESRITLDGQPLDLKGLSSFSTAGLTFVQTEAFAYEPGAALAVDAKLYFKGSQSLHVEPVGKQLKVTLQSAWQDPSFVGARLPDSHVIDDGFTSIWTTNQYSHSYPDHWHQDQLLSSSQNSFGVNLLQPITEYSKNTRSAKYALLIIALTFGLFFFFEIMLHIRVHPIQYILIGFALTVFYLLLLSITEHWGFDKAYVLSSVATIALIVSYARHVLKRLKPTLILALLLTGLFGYIFVILQLQDFAMLAGSLALFAILSVVMMLSRNVNWYDLHPTETQVPRHV